ncbi:HK97 family phage prohead protease [Streptomyces blattellae]|uniref:HK97 family phage prohead protease n=1 Tax=Streptomyces blattellae TaxID=2569855 RepID=UPI001E651636|nr:HK97 family phage prohead protease [Streptomyces blattellae]
MRTLTRTTTEERRRLPLSTADVVIRAIEGDTADERFRGYAAKFNSRTAIGNPLRWGFYEEIAPGAFTKTLQEGDARFLVDHDSYYVVSRVSAGTLSLAEDGAGLPVDSALDSALSYVNDLKANVRNGNITGMSFGFYVLKDQWSTETVETSDGQTVEVEVRRILEVRLIEVSAVTFPAYEDTEAELASVASALVQRGDRTAIEKRARFRPELRDLLQLVGAPSAGDAAEARRDNEASTQELTAVGSEPGESTRETSTPEPAAAPAATEPAETTRSDHEARALRMRGLAARYGLAMPRS